MAIRIAHLSDHQIRNLKRHKEYRQAHENLYKSLEEQKPDLIVFCGDLVHNKTNISPELVDITSDFIKVLARNSPTTHYSRKSRWKSLQSFSFRHANPYH